MDFFSILQNNNKEEQNDDKEQKKDKRKKEKNNKQVTSKVPIVPISDNKDKEYIYNTNLYENLKRGDRVKIIRMENSNLNCYKGYLGEIKDYKKNQDFALVYLLGTLNLAIVKFPLEHFILI